MKKIAARYTVEGETVTIRQIGERLGLSHGAAYARLQTAIKARRPITWQTLGEGRAPSRATEIVRYIVGLGRSATLDEIVEAIALQEPEADRTKLAMTISAQLSQLCQRYGKLVRQGKPRAYTYLPAADALVDRRKAAPQPQRAAKPAAPPSRELRREQIANPTVVIREKPGAPAKRTGEFTINPAKPPPVVVPNANLTRPREGALDSAQIAADIAAFQARGGRVQQLANGQTSQPTKAFLAAQLAAQRPRPSNDAYLDADDIDDVA